MLSKKSLQMKIMILNIDDLIPENHLLKRIDEAISFDFIYEYMQPYYSNTGRPSIDPVCLIKMLLVGYLYGINSERRLVEEVRLNIAYRWFCQFAFDEKIPDHSIFSQNRIRRFKDNKIYEDIFHKLVMDCIEKGIVTGENVVADGSYIPGNVSPSSKIEVVETVEKSITHYLDEIDMELKSLKGYKDPKIVKVEKMKLTSLNDLDSGYIYQKSKKGLGYLCEATVDTKNGIITGVDCYPANKSESEIILKHVKKQKETLGLNIKNIALDAGYDVGAVHRGFELLNIVDYCATKNIHNTHSKKGIIYDTQNDCFICINGKSINFDRIRLRKSKGFRSEYTMSKKECVGCKFHEECKINKNSRITIISSPFANALYKNRNRKETEKYLEMKRLRSIWAEGTFAAMKLNHNLKRHRKRGIAKATEECLLSAIALNLKRMVNAIQISFDFLCSCEIGQLCA